MSVKVALDSVIQEQYYRTDIRAVQGGPPPLRWSGISHLVVQNEVDAPTDSVMGEA